MTWGRLGRGWLARSRRLAPALVLLGVMAVGTHGHAQNDDGNTTKQRLVIDRVELEPSPLWGFDRLRVTASQLALQGKLIEFTDSKQLSLVVGTTPKRVPVITGWFGKTPSPVAVVVVVQNTIDFSEVVPIVKASLAEQLLPTLGPGASFSVVTFGDVVNASRLATGKAVPAQVERVAADAIAAEPALVEAVERALGILRKSQPAKQRKMIVVIADGRDRENDRDRITAVGQLASRDNVRIHTMGFAATGMKRPLLALGELSKQSQGTFRWVRTDKAESWQPVFEQLVTEIERQAVLTFFVPTGELAGKRIHLELTSAGLVSNESKVPLLGCGEKSCGVGAACIASQCVRLAPGVTRAWGKALVVVIVVTIGLIVALWVLGTLLKKRALAASRPGMAAPLPGVAMPPGGDPGAGYPHAAPAASPAPAGPMKTLVVAATPASHGPHSGRPPHAGPPPGVVVRPPMGQPATTPRPPGGVRPGGGLQAPSAPPARQAPTVSPSQPAASMYIVSGPALGQRIAVQSGASIGSAPHCNIVLQDAEVAPRHATLELDGYGNAVITDQSGWGLVVGGSRVRSAPLFHGTIVRIGNTDLRYLAE